MRTTRQEARIPAHIACRPIVMPNDPEAGCFVVCTEHGLRTSFGSAHAVARAACLEHNAVHHPNRRATSPAILSLVYESRAATAFTKDDLVELLSRARVSNSAYGITGMLLTEDDWFLQALEGPEIVVDGLMRSIRRDERHTHVRELSREVRRSRRFPDWAMAEGHIGQVEALPLVQYYEQMLLSRGT